MTTPLVLVQTKATRPWLSRTLWGELHQATSSAHQSGIVALQTAPEAAPSYPMLAFLKAAGIPWVTATPGGDLGNALTPHGEDEPPPRQTPALRIYGSVLHAATEELVIGSFSARMLLASLESEPEHMGPTEPLEHSWDTAAVTEWFRHHMPLGTMLQSGPGFAGAITAYRTDTGVIESFDVLLSPNRSAGGTAGPGRRSLWNVDRHAEVEAAAVAANVQELGIELHFGAVGLTVPAGKDAFRVPQLLVLGPALGRTVQTQAPELAGVVSNLLGTAPFQHLAIRYPESPAWDGGRARDFQQRILAAAARADSP
ncbi:DUF6177 family protein [Arthrobacter sp. NPDC058097]|uniref:DUF6177 family protein n=1 Tax=Arthrobacter sp. NPDC058097 TaxID=3346340 RepID=UPI0036DEF606